MSSAALRLEEVTVRYAEQAAPVLHQISLGLDAGQRAALVGLNGSGKTTLLSAVVGLLPHDGRIEVGGERLERRSVARIRQSIGFLFNVPEDQLLFPRVADDVAFGLVQRRVPAEEASERAVEALAALGIAKLADEPVARLSHGQKQRVALAGALVTRPSLLLLDEPSAALDPVGKRELGRALTALDAAMLVATHDLDFAAELCDRFIVLDDGHLVLDTCEASAVRRLWQPEPAPAPSS